MKVITAPEKCALNDLTDSVFLAGGITDCPWWQNDIIELLSKENINIFNPRRKNFPIHDLNAAYEQIAWEYNALNLTNIFSIWFSAGKSVQPICMYELGRHLALNSKHLDRIVIGIEPGYLREQDVRIQTKLISKDLANVISNNLEQHAQNILMAIENYKNDE